MAYETFPVVPQYPLIKIPAFDTVIISYGGGAEQRISQESNPVWRFKARFHGKTPAQMAVIKDFFIARKGSFDAFYLADEFGTLYLVRFKEDTQNIEYFDYQLYTFGEVEFQQVGAVVARIALSSGSFTLTGSAVALRITRITLTSGSLVLAGTAAGLKATRKITLDSGSFALTGTAITLTKTP